MKKVDRGAILNENVFFDDLIRFLWRVLRYFQMVLDMVYKFKIFDLGKGIDRQGGELMEREDEWENYSVLYICMEVFSNKINKKER